MIQIKPFEDFPPYEDGSVEAGLWCLSMVSEPHHEWRAEDIAHVCGVTRQAVYAIERKALLKLKEAFGRHGLTDLFRSELDEWRHIMDRDDLPPEAIDSVDSSPEPNEMPDYYRKAVARGYARFWAKRGIKVEDLGWSGESFIFGQYAPDPSYKKGLTRLEKRIEEERKNQ